MRAFAEIAEAIGGTSRKSEKVRLLAGYLRERRPEESSLAALFLSGRPFPAWEETTLQVGGALLVRVVLEVSGERESVLESAYRSTGDLGAATANLLAGAGITAKLSPELTLADVDRTFRQMAQARGPAAKAALLRILLERASPLEAKYLVKIITGELRIGLKESLVEEAIALAYQVPVKQVQRANMLVGDIGETLRLAAAQQLVAARMRLFHPLGFMLASPVDSADEAFECFAHAQIEDKYDGIRAQAHCDRDRVRLFSRTLDDVTESFPELVEPLAEFSGVILDGEVLAWDFERGHARPFAELQKRLGRKKVSSALLRSVPVAYVVFDVLYAEGALVIDRPLAERGELLEKLFAEARSHGAGRTRGARLRAHDAQGELVFEPALVTTTNESPTLHCAQNEAAAEAFSEVTRERSAAPSAVLRAPILRADSPAHLDELFARAQARGNEGLMIKDLNSVYTPGRRGRSWLKLKRELATLDAVVTSAEWGHGKRIRVLSDYTFAVRSGAELVNVGKAYNGLTDREIAEMTEWFVAHTTADHGFWREVEPKIVIEVAFNAVMRSDRHNSGYALRFPRIVRLRPDKLPEEIDTLERVRQIYERQQLPKTA